MCRPYFFRVNPDTIGRVWTGEFDLNTLPVNGKMFEPGKKKLRIRVNGASLFTLVIVLRARVTCFGLCSTNPPDLQARRKFLASLVNHELTTRNSRASKLITLHKYRHSTSFNSWFSRDVKLKILSVYLYQVKVILNIYLLASLQLGRLVCFENRTRFFSQCRTSALFLGNMLFAGKY